MSTDIDIRDDVTQAIAAATLFGSDNPGEALERMSVVARTLADVVRKQKLIVRIGQSDHVLVDGWTFCGSLLGVFPIVVWTRPMLDDGGAKVGWEARVEARTRSGELVGSGEAECLRDERSWKSRDDYALRSMAQTRAVSKALRMPLGFVMQLAGFNPTPAEEMPVVESRRDSAGEPMELAATVGEQVASGDLASPAGEDRLFPPVNPETGEILEAGSDPVISDAQRRRLRAIQTRCNVTDDELKDLVWTVCGVTSSKLIPLSSYDALIAAVEARGGGEFRIPDGAA